MALLGVAVVTACGGAAPEGTDSAATEGEDAASDAATVGADTWIGASADAPGYDATVVLSGSGGADGAGGVDASGSGAGGASTTSREVGGAGGSVDHDASIATADAGADGGSIETGASSVTDAEGATADPCNPPPPNGYHTVHFRYPWAGPHTLTLFPKPELMPAAVELKVEALCNTVTCQREQDRPWYNCPVPDAYFVSGAAWVVSDKSQTPAWTTVAERPMPTTPKDYWIRWSYGRPDVPRTQDPPNFELLDYYPDAAYGDWSATGQWNDAMCAAKPPAQPVTVGFNQGGWFPYKNTKRAYPHGGSLASVYADAAKAQDALDAFVFDRYKLWKKNWVKVDADACGAGTARVASDSPQGTVSEGQGYGMAMSAAIGDKELFDKLWRFVRHYRSQAKYCGLMGWYWRDGTDCQPLDSFATGAGGQDSAFDGDADIGIGLVFAARQWPEYADAAADWLVRMECEVNTKHGDGFNYPTMGESWDKSCESPSKCDYAPGTVNRVYGDYYPPGYFRVFGDFLAAKLGASATAANGQPHRDFWYKTAETVYELVERCYDQKGVHPGLLGNGGDIDQPCSDVGGGEPYEWARALWRLGIDAAWFGNNTGLPENAPGASKHFPGKSRMQAKIDNAQGFYADFYKNNPPEPNANRFSSICNQLTPAGTVSNCNPAYGHDAYTVNMAMCPFVSLFDNGGATTTSIRREALEESLSTTVQGDHYFEESLGVYSILFLTGNFPNPMTVSTK